LQLAVWLSVAASANARAPCERDSDARRRSPPRALPPLPARRLPTPRARTLIYGNWRHDHSGYAIDLVYEHGRLIGVRLLDTKASDRPLTLAPPIALAGRVGCRDVESAKHPCA